MLKLHSESEKDFQAKTVKFLEKLKTLDKVDITSLDISNYQKSKNKKLTYKGVNENQIGALIDQSKDKEFYLLHALIAKFVKMIIPGNAYKGIVAYELNKNNYRGDKNFYRNILKKAKVQIKEYESSGFLSSTELIYPELILKLFNLGDKNNSNNSNKKITNYLDIGCGTCKKTKTIGNLIGLDDSNIYGVDVQQWSILTPELRKDLSINFDFIDESGKLPHEDGKFDVISAFMVLHHIDYANLDKLLSEISRCLSPGGLFVLRDHDAQDAIDYMLIDIEHMFYDYIKIPNFNPAESDYFGRYFSKFEWIAILADYGLEAVNYNYDFIGEKSTIPPTRAFHGIFKKT